MRIKLLASVVGLAFASLQAQNRPVFTPQNGALLDGKTIVKTNLLGYALSSYSVSVERLLTKRISLQAGYSHRPESSLGFGIDQLSDEFKTAELRSTSYSLDLRLYLSRRGYGHGFYLQPYFRHENHLISGLRLESYGYNDTQLYPYAVDINMKSNSFGFAIGAQWLFGKKKNFLIDWTIIGVHYSDRANTDINSVLDAGKQITAEEIEAYERDLREFVEDSSLVKGDDLSFDIRDGGKQIGTKISKHPYAFLRASLSFGFRF